MSKKAPIIKHLQANLSSWYEVLMNHNKSACKMEAFCASDGAKKREQQELKEKETVGMRPF